MQLAQLSVSLSSFKAQNHGLRLDRGLRFSMELYIFISPLFSWCSANKPRDTWLSPNICDLITYSQLDLCLKSPLKNWNCLQICNKIDSYHRLKSLRLALKFVGLGSDLSQLTQSNWHRSPDSPWWTFLTGLKELVTWLCSYVEIYMTRRPLADKRKGTWVWTCWTSLKLSWTCLAEILSLSPS